MTSRRATGETQRTRLAFIAALIAVVAVAVPIASRDGAPTAPPTPVPTSGAAIGAAPAPASLGTLAAPGQTPGLQVSGTTTYRLNEETETIDVHIDVTLENTWVPSIYRSYYFNQFGVPAVGPVSNARANAAGNPLNTRVEEDNELGIVFVVVDLVPRLTWGAPQRLEIGYELPAQPNASSSPTRINEAFASWWVVSTGDDGAGRVVIDVPERFEVELGTVLDVATSSVDGRQIVAVDEFDEFDGIFGVTAHDNERLLSRTVEVANTVFTIRAWPDDEEWGDFVADAVTRGIPALIDFIGVDIDEDRDLEIIETATPYIYGYAGWYDRIGGFIEVGDERDLLLILHELSHIWFHGRLFTDRWLLEGLAEVTANRIVGSLDGEAEAVPEIDFSAPGAGPLSQWGHASLLDDEHLSELWAYAASYAVMDRVVENIGEDTLRAVLARAAERELPLKIDPDAEELRRIRDWRYFFDLIDVETDSSEVRAILLDYVVADDDADAFDRRDASMAGYELLADDDSGWAPPYAVRLALSRWTFSKADDAMETAAAVLALRDELDAMIDPDHGLGLDGLRAAYERATRIGDLADIVDHGDDYRDAAGAIGAMEDRIGGANPLQRFGLWQRIDDHRAAAAAAFGDGDFDEVHDRLAKVHDAIDDATMIGLVRALPTVGVTGLWVGLVVLIVRRRQNRADLSDSGA